MKHKPIAPVMVAPQAPTPTPAETLTVVQLERRRQMAQLLCLRAANATSLAMARRLCRQWFPQCNCICAQISEH